MTALLLRRPDLPARCLSLILEMAKEGTGMTREEAERARLGLMEARAPRGWLGLHSLPGKKEAICCVQQTAAHACATVSDGLV